MKELGPSKERVINAIKEGYVLLVLDKDGDEDLKTSAVAAMV
ncbi:MULTISPECIES: hypothetical protein [Aliiglaciecola]|nr:MULTISPECIES: hypothetical protein [Aliiglaciecola]MDO6710252.1 hypothetical protein [Aliiglaciecola sp. 2_MG-2023]MDO6751400.1 hypothetical protein [Aliiglaciecola sp. 1_MG-2023]